MEDTNGLAPRLHDIVQSLTVADILKSYSGKPGCACGCNGNYRVTPESRKEADEDRGYAHDDEDVNTRSVLQVLRKVQAHEAEAGSRIASNKGEWGKKVEVADDLQYVHAQVSERRVYTVYLTSAARHKLGVQSGFALK